ncbi:uncharacterized protein LOC116337332 isoform X2 [Contarinia nasturtii]|uniref:uncharacterized protein LOC116337332 isoform X2 n=1 Tax=Contarinia nasturtii TaxID=265458 RepID=UPI0012D4BF9F|nr:uncharacterized protein LOC116337332 isoform X2 [Contarinia nasturtii]
MHRKNFDTKQPDEARLALTEPSIVASLSTSTLSSNAKATADLCTEKKQLNDDSKTIVANIKNILTQLPNLTDNRIGLLTAAWLNLQNLIQNKNEDFKNCMQWIIKYTLDSMLTELTKSDAGDLEELKIRINECASLVQEEANFWYRCKYILENIDAPWSHPTLQLIFNDGKNSPTIISKEQLEKEIEYFTIERGCMIDMRVKKLIASKCDRFAMNFVTEALRAIQTCTDDHMLRRVVSLGQNQSLLEIYFSFLYKFKESSRLKVELEAMHLDSAKEFILNCFATIDFYEATNQRLRSTIHASNAMKKAHPAAARLHKYHVSVSQYALQLILVRLLAGEYGNDGVEATFRDLLTEWIRRNREQENFDKLFHKLIQTASSNSRIYECCEILYDLYPNDCETALRIFCSELTKEINILEHKKYDETVNASVILSLEKQTSSRYLTLGKILHAHKKLEKECVLTAFSMNPTHECFQLVCSLATENLAPQVTPHLETIDALPTIICTDMLLNSKEYDALRAPNRLLDSLTSISEEVRSDLVCLLTVPRIKNLNWLVPWPELKQACEELLFTERKRQIVEKTTAGANDNLKYINDNLNYDDFKNFAPHEYPGIEKGYEIYVANSDSDESPVLGTGDSDSDGTDTAPESKQFIVKEEKRLRDRKRRLIRRSQKLLEMSENNMQPEKMSKELDQKKKKPRRLKQMTSDSLKPGKSNRKTQSKQQLYTEYNNIQKDTTSNFGNINNKVESSLDIKTEPLDDHLEIQHDGDVSETFVDRSNIPHLKSENCTINNSFFEITQNQYDDHVQQSQRNGTFAKNDIMPLSNFSELTCLPQQFEQSDNESTTICYNTELVNSIIFDESKNESPEQPFSKICDEDFDEDDKANIHFQHIVMNKILGLNEKQVSHFTNDDTVNNIELNQETKSKSPVINELCPLKPSVEIENIALQNSSSKTLCDVPYTSNITISNPNVQSSKPKKNPLLAFRRPKKIPNKSNDMFAKELNEYTNTITESLPNSFNLEDNSQNNMTENMDHNQENNILTCVTDQKVVSKYQFNKQIDEDLQNTEMDTSSSIVILTKHCTVRLNRIPNLDRMDSSIHLAPLDSSSNKSDDFNVKFNYDQLTNGKSSSDNTSQRSQNSNEVKIPAEEDEDEDRKTNLLLPYSSINSSHNNYGNDDDDDCNSSEDTKTNCPGEHVSLKTEQNSGEKQQQQKQQQQKQQQKQQQQQHHCTESNKHEYKMLQHMSSEKQLCSKQTFLMQNRNSDNMVKHLKCR